MNFTKLASAFFLSSSLIFSAACGVGDAVNDVQKGLTDAAAAAKKQEQGKKGFESAVSGVTAQVLSAALSSIDTSPSPAPSYQTFAQASTSGSANVDTTSTINGGTVTAKGTISYTFTYDYDATAGTMTNADAKITLDLASTWTNMTITTDGTANQSSGNLKMTGTIEMTMADQNSQPVVTATITEVGKFNLGADNYDVNVVITANDNGGSYTGTINNNPVSGTFTNAND